MATDKPVTKKQLDKALDSFEKRFEKKLDKKMDNKIKASEERMKEYIFEVVDDASNKVLEGVERLLEYKPSQLEKIEVKVSHNTQEIREIRAQLATN
jgi:predicted RNase H-like nuclease